MKRTITLTSLLFLSFTSLFSQVTSITMSDSIVSSGTSCGTISHFAVYYNKVQKFYSDSMPLQTITVQELYTDAKSKGAVKGGYLHVEVALMESNNYVCDVKKYKILTPDFFELTKKNYCLGQEANFAKNRVNYDGMETITVYDSAMNLLSTGALFTPSIAGKHYIRFMNQSAGITYMDSVTVYSNPSISFSTPIPNSINGRMDLVFPLDSHINHNGITLESNSPGVLKDTSGNLSVHTLYLGKFHNIMNYSAISSNGCKSTLVDTIFVVENLGANSPVPIINIPSYIHSDTIGLTPSGFSHTTSNVPMSVKKHECDGTIITLTNNNTQAFNYNNYSYIWYSLIDNELTNLNNASQQLIYTIPNNNENDIIQILIAVVENSTLDTSLFFNEIIQTYQKPTNPLICSDLGDSTKIDLLNSTTSNDIDNYYWRNGSFDRQEYNSVNKFNYINANGNYITNSQTITNENTSKINKYQTVIEMTVPAKGNLVYFDVYVHASNGTITNLRQGHVSNTCYIFDSLPIINNVETDINFTSSVNSSGLIPYGGSIGHTVNNSVASDTLSLNYFTDIVTGANGSYTPNNSGFLHAGYIHKDKYGCDADSTFYNLYQVAMPVGIEEIGKESFSVFPNPFTTHITIETSNVKSANVRLYNLFGSLVYQSNEAINGFVKLSIPENLPAGTYFIQVIGEGKGFSQKIVKL